MGHMARDCDGSNSLADAARAAANRFGNYAAAGAAPVPARPGGVQQYMGRGAYGNNYGGYAPPQRYAPQGNRFAGVKRGRDDQDGAGHHGWGANKRRR